MFKMYENLKIINMITNVIYEIVFSCPYTVNVCKELDIPLKIKIKLISLIIVNFKIKIVNIVCECVRVSLGLVKYCSVTKSLKKRVQSK